MSAGRDPFRGRPHTPGEHFRLLFWGGVLHLRRLLGPVDDAALPFFRRYLYELEGSALLELSPAQGAQRWQQALTDWEARAPSPLPLCALRTAAGLDPLALLVWAATGVVEEDPRFGVLVEALAGVPGQHRPTAAVLGGEDEELRVRVRAAVGQLEAAALLERVESAPPAQPGLRPAPVVWAAARGDPPDGLDGLRVVPVAELPGPEAVLLEPALRDRVRALAALPAERTTDLAVVVSGPETSGRRTLLRAVARAWGRPVLEHAGEPSGAGSPPAVLGPLATLLGAVPVLPLDPPPGASARLPWLPASAVPLGVTLPARTTIGDDGERTVVVLSLAVPERGLRCRHWQQSLPGAGQEVVQAAAEHRLPAGTIRRVARQATAAARLAGRSSATATDVAEAARTHRGSRLDTLAVRVAVARGWEDLAVGAATAAELYLLERRCRWREALARALPDGPGRPGTGVRALFTGASGTGKTLAARCLAGALGKDLYLLDTARIVDQYLGVTEKNMDRALRQAEALDVVLLVDEGDALLGRRTDVRSSNDRYANLQTDYLLQRLEAHDGIVVVTTNAESRIDDAFLRRLDVVIPFSQPAAAERYAVWQAHLPDGDLLGSGLVGASQLTEIALRCALTGGQIRNAVLHACLLALDAGNGHVTDADLGAAVRREYAKTGALCPLPEPSWDDDGGDRG